MKALLIFALLTATAVAAEPKKEDLLAVLREDPSDPSALYNLGLMNYLEDDFSGAIKNWKTLRSVDPDNWRVREKLIQGYWGAGDVKSAKAEIEELRKTRESGKYSELNEKAFFICDQFRVGEVRAFVLEYYSMEGERPLAWKFILREGDETLDHYLSVGSYASATAFAKSEGTIGPDERCFHLDGYWNSGAHATYNFYRNRPDYQDVRKEVQRIIKGDQKPMSTFTPDNIKSEKDGAGQPAAAPESKSKGGEKPVPKSEGRPK